MRVRAVVAVAGTVAAGALVLPAAAGPVGSEVDPSALRSASAWTPAPDVVVPPAERLVAPLAGAVHLLDAPTIDGALRRATPDAAVTVSLPTPDGTLERFAVTPVRLLEPGLAARYPGIRAYTGRGVDEPAASLRLTLTPLGLSASVIGDGEAWYVDPVRRGDAVTHVAYDRTALPLPAQDHLKREPLLLREHAEHGEHAGTGAATAGTDTVPLRTYRLAMVSDPSYARNSGAAAGLDAAAPDYAEQLAERVVAAKAVMVSRVNQVYETDLGITMVLVDGTERLGLNTAAEATGANGPCGADPCFTPAQVASCSSSGLNRNGVVTGLLVGASGFDVGHLVLGTDGGGIAGLGVVGDTRKAAGCTGLLRPVGDFFAIDYVAHEIGHQFGANHTFNGTQGSCAATNRNLTGATAVEPGSGSSVMAYAGICADDDLQAHTDPYFSHASISEVQAYTRTEAVRSSVQVLALRRFDGTDSYVLGYGGARTAPVVRGSSHTAAGIKAALEAVLPSGATVTVTGVTDGGATIAFGGALAGVPVELLTVSATGADAFVGETTAGGPTTRGGRPTASENRPPVVTAPAEVRIPVQTPFVLSARGSDPDGDVVTYLWEQADGGLPVLGNSLQDPVRPLGPLFRVFGTAARYASEEDAYLSPSPGQNTATTDPSRTFPDLAQVAAGNTNALTGACPPQTGDARVDCLSEQLPTAAWLSTGGLGDLRFRVTARDGVPGVGGTATADTVVRVVKGAGPFRVLDLTGRPDPTAPGALLVAWDVARTDVLLGTSQVRITLSEDGGRTFPHVLAATTANDGLHSVTVPAGVATTRGRLRVEAVGGAFFDVSRTDLVLAGR
jgi:hypothetical protein